MQIISKLMKCVLVRYRFRFNRSRIDWNSLGLDPRNSWEWNRTHQLQCIFGIDTVYNDIVTDLIWLRYVIKTWYLSTVYIYPYINICQSCIYIYILCQNDHSMSFKSIYFGVIFIDSWGKIPSDYQSRQQSWNVWCAVCSLLPSFIAAMTFLWWPVCELCFWFCMI